MSKARELAELGAAYDSGALSNRNLVINGNMQVWQRATSATTVSNSTYQTVDRWKFYENTDGAYTTERSTDTPSGTGFSLKAAVTTADTSIAAAQYASIEHYVEAQNCQQLEYGTSSAKTITLSFFVKSSKTGTYTIALYKPDNTGYIYTREYTIDSANTWEKKTINITPTAGSTSLITSSGGAIANDNGLGLAIGFNLVWGSNFFGTNDSWSATTSKYTTTNAVNWMDSTSNNFYLAEVQMEVGDTATPFEHRTFADELHRCQRYFEVIVSGNSREIGGGNYYSSSAIHCPTIFETSKRTNSYSVTVTGGTNYFRVYRNGASDDFDGFSGSTRANINRCLLYANSGVSGTAGHGLELLTNNASAKIVVDDEL